MIDPYTTILFFFEKLYYNTVLSEHLGIWGLDIFLYHLYDSNSSAMLISEFWQ